MRPSSEPIASQEAQKTYWQKSISLIKSYRIIKETYWEEQSLFTSKELFPNPLLWPRDDNVCVGSDRRISI